MTTKDYLYSNNIDTDLLVVIGGLIVILFLMMLIMYFINSLRHKELTEILEKISFPEKSGSNLLKPEAVSCNLLSLCAGTGTLYTQKAGRSLQGDHRGECAGNCMDAGEQSY
ncbi:TPA: hypothetical protein L4S74_004691 [Escherichia coli]|nr:hypothetical protein [Escherichia coli]HBO4582456.1 hypothetical protein [Escherichia coli]